jgi:glycosyltransferase involved in cell wall biosynthesis
MSATLVLLTFNQERYVADAVRSVLLQACEPIDILISDDASTDGTVGIVEALISSYMGPHRVKFNKNPLNLGISNHINYCMKIIETDIVIAAAGDDMSRPDRVARVLEMFRSTGALLVHSRVHQIGVDGDALNDAMEFNALFTKSASPLQAALSGSLYIGATGSWHRLLFDRYGEIRNPECYEDLIIGFRAALEERIGFIDEALVFYRVGTGVSTDALQNSLAQPKEARLKNLRRMLNVLEHRLVDAELSEHPNKNTILKHIRRGIRKNALRMKSHEAHPAVFLIRHLFQLPYAIRALKSERRALHRLRG